MLQRSTRGRTAVGQYGENLAGIVASALSFCAPAKVERQMGAPLRRVKRAAARADGFGPPCHRFAAPPWAGSNPSRQDVSAGRGRV